LARASEQSCTAGVPTGAQAYSGRPNVPPLPPDAQSGPRLAREPAGVICPAACSPKARICETSPS
jgi:hypothetical protein